MGVPLPVDLDFLGLAGCSLQVAPHGTAATITVPLRPGEGVATVAYDLPNDPVLLGASAYAQWLVLDPPGSLTLGATTRGLEIAFQ